MVLPSRLHACISAATSGADEGAYVPSPAEVGLSEQTWSRQKEALASIWCEQKWTDLIAGKLATQAGQTAVEFGTLLRRLQHRYASMLDRALKLHSDALWQLDAAAASVVKCHEHAAETSAATAAREDAHAAEVVALQARIDELERNEAQTTLAAKKDAEEKLERTRVALDTMKDLFHDLSREKTALGAFDLRDQAERLKAQLGAATEELSSLRLLRDEAATAKSEAGPPKGASRSPSTSGVFERSRTSRDEAFAVRDLERGLVTPQRVWGHLESPRIRSEL